MKQIIRLTILCLSVSILSNVKLLSQNNINADNDFYTYPTPSDIFEVIERDKVSFNKDLLNSVENVETYTYSKSNYLNLGVYMSDLAFCAFFRKRQKSLDYMEVVSKLSNNLLISDELKQHIREDIFENANEMDSIYKATTEHYYDIMRELSEYKSDKVIYIITTGAYIETFYIALNSIQEFSNESALLKRIAEEKFSLFNLNRFSEKFNDDFNIVDVIKYQEELLDIFNSFKVDNSVPRTFKINAQGKLEFEGGEKISMNKEQFEKLKESVERIRNEIIN